MELNHFKIIQARHFPAEYHVINLRHKSIVAWCQTYDEACFRAAALEETYRQMMDARLPLWRRWLRRIVFMQWEVD